MGRHAWYALGVRPLPPIARSTGWVCTAALAVPLAAAAQAAPVRGPLVLTAEGKGIQVYRCDTASGAPAWVLDHPDAELRDLQGNLLGKHSAGPTWQYKDGSTVVGQVLTKHPGKTDADVPWLSLRAVSHAGHGLFSRVETIERTDTVGGTPPAAGCDAAHTGQTQMVPYAARYSFYAKP